MFVKRLTVWACLLWFVAFVAAGVAFADDLIDIQKRIKDKDLKWTAERHANPEKKGLGLLKDGFLGSIPSTAGDGQVLLGLSPAALDWRNVGADNALGVLPGNYVSPVKNQGSCGSCWAFATTATAESTTQIALNEPIGPYVAYDLSEQVMLTCSGGGSCSGGSITTPSTYLANTGLLREDPVGCYTYNISSTTCPNPTSYSSCDQSRYRIDGWSSVSATVDAMKNALNNYGPLVTTFAVRKDFYNYYKNGVYQATSCDSTVNPLVGYHAVSVVGYQDADANNPVGYFIVKNSWASSWGESGYFRIGYSQVSNCVGFGASTLAYSKTSCTGAVSVISPVATDTWQAGTAQTITWNASGSIGQYVKIDLYKAGAFVRTLKSTALASDESYQWTVDSDLAGSGYSVMITSTTCNSAYGVSSDFSISPAATFSVSGVVTSAGTGISGVTITFSRTSGTGAIPASLVTDGNGAWGQTGFQKGTSYRATPSKTGSSFSPAYLDFTAASTSLNSTLVENKIVSVPLPGSNSSWKAGSTCSIGWTYSGNPGTYVRIDLIDGTTGATTTISSRTRIGSGGVGSYSWRISKQQKAANYQIKITSTTNNSAATSGTFAVTP